MSDLPDQSWPAPAKLNLMLRILGQRADGYHDLQTVFQFLDFGDTLKFRLRSDGNVLRVRALPGVAAGADLSVRAARLLQQRTETSLGADIQLDKRLPMGGGLGGGSSDAATTLLVLNQLWDTGLTQDELIELGQELGADVPVFLFGKAAWAEGTGERLIAVDLQTPWYLVLKPPCEVSTASIFQDPELTRDSYRITIRDFLAGETGNDFQPLVARKYPEVKKALDWLGQFASARLTGTGSCVFAAFDSKDQAQKVLDLMPGIYQGFLARGLNQSPLHRLLAI